MTGRMKMCWHTGHLWSRNVQLSVEILQRTALTVFQVHVSFLINNLFSKTVLYKGEGSHFPWLHGKETKRCKQKNTKYGENTAMGIFKDLSFPTGGL